MADPAPAVVAPEVVPAVEPAAVVPAKASEPPKPEPSLVGGEVPKEPEVKPEEKPGEKKPDDKPAVSFDAEKIKLPEGFVKDEKFFPKFAEIMNNEKMSPQERGQELTNLYADAVKSVAESNTKAWTELQTKWQGEVKADKDFGGDKLQPTLQSINKALETSLAPAEVKAFKEALDATGAGNNPAFFRGMAKIAALLTEGGHVPGNPGSGKQDLASIFFNNSPDMKGDAQ